VSDIGSSGEGREGTLSHFRTVVKTCKLAPVVYGMVREMIYVSFIPYWASEGCRG